MTSSTFTDLTDKFDSVREIDGGVTSVASGSWWHLEGGVGHLLYCGTPDSPSFLNHLSDSMAPVVAFPPSSEGRFPVRRSLMSFKRELEAPSRLGGEPAVDNGLTAHIESFLGGIGMSIEDFLKGLRTTSREVTPTLVFAGFPAPELLLLVNSLGYRCSIAEPDSERCQALVQTWRRWGFLVWPHECD